MKRCLFITILAVIALFLVCAIQAQTPGKKPVPKAETKNLAHKKAKQSGKLVDINHGTKAELKTVDGITDAYADRIIAGRPYLTKAHLVTHDILPMTLYTSIKHRIYAKQKP